MSIKKRVYRTFLLITCMMTAIYGLHSCDEDEYHYPSLITELAEVKTDANGMVASILTDGGSQFSPNRPVSAGVNDTILRCICAYETDEEKEAFTLYSLKTVFCTAAIPATELTERNTDPLKVESVWQGGIYLNLSVGILTEKNGVHTFGFSEDSISVSSEGICTAHFTLLHKRPDNDAETYTEKETMCLPLKPYLTDCDSATMTINTYDGMRTYALKIKRR